MNLIRNAAKCKRCGDVVESKRSYHFAQCTCKLLAVDGGLTGARVIGGEAYYEILWEWATIDNPAEVKIKDIP
ncbi:DUF7695 domain-containing protein [Chryseolinea serpens]|uniref:DUF7695 domain-containing protein n=1 Tax=Chryseolinea serpens TaxID=947013 RepID=UPI000934CF81|nr:hypothetical protein [Chryseolinea serpens]